MLSDFPPGFGCSQPLALLLPAPAGSPGVLTPHRHRAGCWHVPVTCGVPLCPCSRHQQAARCQLVSAPHESLAPKQGAQHPGLWGCVTPPQLLGTTGGPVPCPTALPGSGTPRDMLPTRFPSACWEVPEVGSHCGPSNPPLGVWVPREGFAAPRQPLTTCWVCRGVGFLLFPWHKSWGGSSRGSVRQGGPGEGQGGETHTMSPPGTSSFICNSSREGKREREQRAGSILWQLVRQPGRFQSVGKELSPSLSPAGQSSPGCEQRAGTGGGTGMRRSRALTLGKGKERGRGAEREHLGHPQP